MTTKKTASAMSLGRANLASYKLAVTKKRRLHDEYLSLPSGINPNPLKDAALFALTQAEAMRAKKGKIIVDQREAAARLGRRKRGMTPAKKGK